MEYPLGWMGVLAPKLVAEAEAEMEMVAEREMPASYPIVFEK
jgi:hypothetical protein